MDPFTITSSVLRITGSCVGAAKTLWDIRKAWNRAPTTVSTLGAQLKLTAASLSQIQSLLLNNTDILHEKPDLVETFDTTLTSCLVLSTWLDKYMQQITRGVLDCSKATWKMKFKLIWNEDDIKELLNQLHTQQGAISVLVNLLQMDSISEIRRLVRRHEALLQEIARNTQDLRRTHAVDAPASILGTDEEGESIFDQLKDKPGSKDDSLESSFENIVLSSSVYTKTFTGVLHTTLDDQSDDARTIIEAPPVYQENPSILSSAQIESNSKTSKMLLDTPQLRSSIDILGVDDIVALTMVDHTAQSKLELSFKGHQTIFDLEKISPSRYRGRLFTGQASDQAVWGQFDRDKVIIDFHLRAPLRVRMLRAHEEHDDDRHLSYRKDEILNVWVFRTFPYWGPTIQTIEPGRKIKGNVYMGDLDFESKLKDEVDRLFKFVSNPIPALGSFSKNEQKQWIVDFASESDMAGHLKLLAHCSSLEELNYAAPFCIDGFEG